MNQEIKSKWIEALRSGKYEQGKHVLYREENNVHKFCCLGVLCDLYLKEKNKEWQRSDDSQILFLAENSRLNLPKEVINWSGLSDERGYFVIPGKVVLEEQPHTLTFYNDTKEYNFEQISELIEKYL